MHATHAGLPILTDIQLCILYYSVVKFKMGDPDPASDEHNPSEEACGWKAKLSAALNDEQIFFSLFLLGTFYVGYTLAKAKFDASATSLDDEERFIQSCYCSVSQRSFYRSWFLLFSIIWLIIHTYTFLTQVFAGCCKGCGDIVKGLLTIFSIFSEIPFRLIRCLYLKCNNGDPAANNQQELQLPLSDIPVEKRERNIRVLWFQYCKLYVVGYTKDDEVIDISNKNNKDETDGTKIPQGCCFLECKGAWFPCSCCLSLDTYQPNSEENSCDICCFKYNKQSHQKSDHSNTYPDINIKCCNQYFPNIHILKSIIRGFLFLVKYASQLVTVPLLFLQMFDTYSLLCFSPDLYCSRTSEYKLHLAQAAITLLFYCSLALSQLTSTMLIWNPWPKNRSKDRSKDNKKPNNRCEATLHYLPGKRSISLPVASNVHVAIHENGTTNDDS